MADHMQLPRGAISGTIDEGFETSAHLANRAVCFRLERNGASLALFTVRRRRRDFTARWDDQKPVPVHLLPLYVCGVVYTIKLGAQYMLIIVTVLPQNV